MRALAVKHEQLVEPMEEKTQKQWSASTKHPVRLSRADGHQVLDYPGL